MIPKWLETVIRLIYPPTCSGCGSLMKLDRPFEICEICQKSLSYLDDGWFTLQKDGPLDQVMAVMAYEGIARELIKSLKYRGQAQTALLFGWHMNSLLKNMTSADTFDIVIGVPMFRRKEAVRGYNQANLIANHLSILSGIPYGKKVLLKQKNTKPQNSLHRRERLHNLMGAFRVRKPSQVVGMRILLVDDVLTTGSTLTECARILKQSGALSVHGMVGAVRKRRSRKVGVITKGE